jgi:hypothetical protein
VKIPHDGGATLLVGDRPMTTTRYFLSYTGVKLPMNLVSPLTEADLKNRNTFMRASYDDQDRLTGWDKMVYGDVQLSHRYDYHPNGALKQAVIVMDEDTTVLDFDETGRAMTPSPSP